MWRKCSFYWFLLFPYENLILLFAAVGKIFNKQCGVLYDSILWVCLRINEETNLECPINVIYIRIWWDLAKLNCRSDCLHFVLWWNCRLKRIFSFPREITTKWTFWVYSPLENFIICLKIINRKAFGLYFGRIGLALWIYKTKPGMICAVNKNCQEQVVVRRISIDRLRWVGWNCIGYSAAWSICTDHD